ncbi:DNA polymerase IV [Candidatus Desantisbacteria bacterium]|nr:DNA polymerase IV [Candidatus Desantisbacteria bacterium]
MDRIILHLDMNAFFASVEQASNPHLRGKPIAVIGSEERTVVTTCSYEARAFGIKTGMTKYEAKKLCPEIILVPGNNQKYIDTSVKIIGILKNYTSLIEVFSIDEAFLDITNSLTLFHKTENIARLIKKKINDELGLLCSIGIAPNKLLAKLASDMKKPDGLVIIKKEEISGFIKDLPVSNLCGIGEKLAAYLKTMGIKTCGELGRYPVKTLKQRFGVIGERLHNMGLGIDESPVVSYEEDQGVKSVGHSMTLTKDVSDINIIHKYILQLSEMVGRRIRKYGYSGKTIVLTIRYKDFTTFTKQLTIESYINNDLDIYFTALKILKSIKLEQEVRLLGVTITSLIKYYHQLSLFGDEDKKNIIGKTMDKINDRFGDFTITHGNLIMNDHSQGVISPSWRPSGVRRVEVK